MATTIIRLPEVIRRTGLSRSTIYSRMRDGTFPMNIPLGPKCVGWSVDEIEDFLRDRIAHRDARIGSRCLSRKSPH
ncbi:helix-turn-helix transcriptional regulator [Lentisalinibacter sediminis]|uniref:helix-turn-helix transcriptional regulator n=1 Tax=Lentisalinibacter sediminis TaxID=2992237 RepID=UPI00386F8015